MIIINTQNAIKNVASLIGLLLSINCFAQNNWTLTGTHINNNNAGLVGINLPTTVPAAQLDIKTNLLDYVPNVGTGFSCVGGTLGLKLTGTSWNYSLDETFVCNPFPTIPNLFEAHIEFGNYSAPWITYTSTRRVTIDSEGRFGIGNNLNPTQDLDVEGSIRMRLGAQNGYIATSSADGTMSWQPSSNFGYWKPTSGASPGTGHIMNKANGEVHIGNVEYAFFLDPYLGASHYTFLAKTGDVGLIFGPTSEGGVSQNEPGLVIASKNPGNGGKNGLRIDWNGNVMIGSNKPGMNTNASNTYKLAVGGNILAELVRVKLVSTWPDFVFLEDYKMLTLPELENYIDENGHLPNVPTEEEVQDEGIDLGEMNRILLQKIEELTLYVIELEKRVGEKD